MTISLDAQIQALEESGIVFNILTREDAKKFLSHNTYYFKLKSYRANYRSEVNERSSAPIEFAFLVELSKLDFHLSRTCWSMCMGIEHSIKIRLNQHMMNHSDPAAIRDAGRAFVNNYLTENPSREDSGDLGQASTFSKRYKEVHANYYTEDLVAAKQDDFAPWHLWELLSFGHQVGLYRSMLSSMSISDPHLHLLFVVQKLRNAVSHGNCLLTDVMRPAPSHRHPDPMRDRELVSAARQLCGIPKKRNRRTKAFDEALGRLIVHNFAALMHCYLIYVESDGMLKHTVQELRELIVRIERNKDSYFGDAPLPNDPQRPNLLLNEAVFSTLNAVIRLSTGFIHHAEAKLNGKPYPPPRIPTAAGTISE